LKSLSGIWRSGKYQQASTPAVPAAAADGTLIRRRPIPPPGQRADEHRYAGSSFTMADEFIWNVDLLARFYEFRIA